MASSIEITAPDSAEEGATVPVSVEIRNISEFHYSFRTGIYANVDLLLLDDASIRSGSVKTYDTPFIMPAEDVTILVWVERWAFDHWEYDNSDDKVVSLTVAPPPPPPPPCSIEITAPDSAQQGETVNLSAVITNNSPYAQLYKTEMYADAEFIGSIEDNIPGYSSRTYGGSFVMPASDATILIWVERWSIDYWEYDNSDDKVVSLTVAPPEPEFRGFGVTEYTRR